MTDQKIQTTQKKTKNSDLLLDSSETVKVKKYCLDEESEKIEYEAILNNPNIQVFRDQFIFDKLGRAQIVLWLYDNT